MDLCSLRSAFQYYYKFVKIFFVSIDLLLFKQFKFDTDHLISIVGHVSEALYFRLWWLLPTVCLAGVGEIIGWIGRLISSHSPGDLNPYLIQ